MLQNLPPIKRLIFALTTYCNLTCRECVAGIPLIAHPEHYSHEYIEQAASFFFGIEHLTISGGEPMMHPQFRQIIPELKILFGCQVLTLVTNAYKAAEDADVFRYFDQVVVSQYHTNQHDVQVLAGILNDRNKSGLTLHVCTARRARQPKPCSRAYTIKYMYGQLYPCCAIPNGCEEIGIPLTRQWRDEIRTVPLPCEDCCFAEEEGIEADVDFADIASLSKRTRGRGIRKPGWPTLRPEIEMYGLDLDSWMGQKAFIRCYPENTTHYMRVWLESHGPRHLYPITLSFQDEHHGRVHHHVIKKPGTSETRVKVSRPSREKNSLIVKLTCDPTFIPKQINPTFSDSRELGVRILSLGYE
jgi:hypothetical protein